MKQETRQWAWGAVFYGSFAVAFVIACLRIAGHVGPEWGVTVIVFMGIGIAAAVRLSRMRLTETMLSVYKAGVESARAQQSEREELERRIIEASREG
jgi:hypothetical protein